MEIFQGKYRPLELLRYAGMFTWFCTVIPLFFMPMLRETPLPQTQYTTWWVLQMLYGMMYWHLTSHLWSLSQTPVRLLYLLLLTACALGISEVSESALGGILLLIVASLLPWMLSVIPATIWLIIQSRCRENLWF